MEIVCTPETYRRFKSSSLRQQTKHPLRVLFCLALERACRNSEVFGGAREQRPQTKFIFFPFVLSALRSFANFVCNISSLRQQIKHPLRVLFCLALERACRSSEVFGGAREQRPQTKAIFFPLPYRRCEALQTLFAIYLLCANK